MAVIAPIANFGILEKLYVPGEAGVTAGNLLGSPEQLQVAIALFFMVVILDVVVAWALYLFLKRVSKALSLTTAILRWIYSLVLLYALFSLVEVSRLSGSGPEQLAELAPALFDRFLRIWDFGLGIFGLHLMLLGILVYRAAGLPRFLGILVLIAGAGYLVDFTGKMISSSYTFEISIFTFIGEVLLIFWLIIPGLRKSKMSASEL